MMRARVSSGLVLACVLTMLPAEGKMLPAEGNESPSMTSGEFNNSSLVAGQG
jgi:hypothetical protein